MAKSFDVNGLFEQLTSREPKDIKKYFFIPKPGQHYILGTTTPLIANQLRRADIAGEPFIVPSSAVLGKQPIDYAGIYICLEQYFKSALKDILTANKYMPLIIDYLLREYSKEDFIFGLSILNQKLNDSEQLDIFVNDYCNFFKPEIKNRLNNLVEHGKQWLLARQPILLAMRTVLTYKQVEKPRTSMPLLVASTMLCHAISTTLYEKEKENKKLEGTNATERLALELIQNMIFNESQDILGSLDVTLRLWEHYGNQIKKNPLRKSPESLFKEATGIDLRDLLALGFGLYSHTGSWKNKKPSPLNINGFGGTSKNIVGGFVTSISASIDEFRVMLANSKKPWDLLTFQQRPVIRIGNKLVVLDQSFLIQRLTNGIYWDVHDSEKAKGESFRLRWTQAFAEMLEVMSEEELKKINIPILGGATQTFYTEEDFKKAFGIKSKHCDAALDYGSIFCLFEIVRAQPTLNTRIQGDPEAFKKDVEKIVIKKVRQLNDTSNNLLNDDSALTGFKKRPKLNIVPVVITPGGFPFNPLISAYVQSVMRTEKLLVHSRIDPLSIIDIEELQMIISLSEGGISIPEIFKKWKKSSLHNMPLKNYLLAAFPNNRFRQKNLKKRTDQMFADIISRLKISNGQKAQN